MSDKEEVARTLAQAHYRYEPGITKIFRLLGTADAEARPSEPIKLLEVNQDTVPSGILPLQFDADPPSGINYPSVILEVTPGEFDEIEDGALPLPNGWKVGELLPRPLEPAGADT